MKNEKLIIPLLLKLQLLGLLLPKAASLLSPMTMVLQLRPLILCALLCLALPGALQATMEVILDGTEFNSANAFADAWNYNYPWGQTHNGSAKMWSVNDMFAGGVLTIQSVPFIDGTYNYSSGTVYSKQQVLVNDQCPSWDVSGDFQCESQRGTWPAFWLTGVNTWPPESDIMEFKGSTTCWLNTYDGLWESLGVVVSSPISWHTYRAVLTKLNATDVTIQYYIDGVLKSTQTGSSFVGAPMWLIIDYQMEGSSGTPGPTSTTYMRGRNVKVSRDNTITTLPATPSGVTAAGGNTEVYLGWAASSGASTYKVKRATVSGGPYTTIKTNVFSTGYTDTGLANNTTYYYIVSAVNPIGESTSAQVSATPITPAITPANSGFETPITDGYIYNPSGGSWTFSTGTGTGSGVTANGSAFTAGNAPAPQGAQVAFLQATGNMLQTVSGFIPGTAYTVKFLASQRQNKSGGQVGQTFDAKIDTTVIGSFEPVQSVKSYVEYTATFTATAASHTLAFIGTDLHTGDNTVFLDRVLITSSAPPPPPAAPAGLTATAASSSQINLSWSASSGASNYNVKRATVSGGPYTTVVTGVTATSYSDTGLGASTTYYYVVSAVNAGGQSANSAQASATTQAPALPSAPTGVTAMAGNTQVSLSWTASSGATSYRIKRATVSGGPYTIIATNSTTSYTNTGLVNGTAYYYVVSAVNAVGESPNSAQVSSTPNAGSLPPAPMGLTAALTGNNTDVRLNWTAVAGATSYKVKRAAINGGPYTLVASPTTNTYTDTSSKTQGTTYYYVVSVVNATGEGPNSAQVSIVP